MIDYQLRAKEGDDSPTQIPLPRLLGRQRNQPGLAKEIPDQIGEYIIADNEQSRQYEPAQPFIQVKQHAAAGNSDEQYGQVGPPEQVELVAHVALLQGHHEQ